MVLESLITPIKGEQHPFRSILLGFVYYTVGIFMSLWIFKEYASLITVFFTTMAAIPLVYNTIRYEETKDSTHMTEKRLLREHAKALTLFMSLFIGVTLASAIWYIFLPAETTQLVFKVQAKTIVNMNPGAQGFATQAYQSFIAILANNIKVLIFCILFSFLYGVGAIFILTWNASVIGVAIGNFIRTEIYDISTAIHWNFAANYLNIVSFGLLRYTIHGIPEILSYFVAGLAGGIISTAAIKHDFGTKAYEKIILDSSVLMILSLLLVVLSAFLEVFVTPTVFSVI